MMKEEEGEEEDVFVGGVRVVVLTPPSTVVLGHGLIVQQRHLSE